MGCHGRFMIHLVLPTYSHLKKWSPEAGSVHLLECLGINRNRSQTVFFGTGNRALWIVGFMFVQKRWKTWFWSVLIDFSWISKGLDWIGKLDHFSLVHGPSNTQTDKSWYIHGLRFGSDPLLNIGSFHLAVALTGLEGKHSNHGAQTIVEPDFGLCDSRRLEGRNHASTRNPRTQPAAHSQMRTMVLEYLPPGKLTVCYGSHSPFVADGPIENGDFL